MHPLDGNGLRHRRSLQNPSDNVGAEGSEVILVGAEGSEVILVRASPDRCRGRYRSWQRFAGVTVPETVDSCVS